MPADNTIKTSHLSWIPKTLTRKQINTQYKIVWVPSARGLQENNFKGIANGQNREGLVGSTNVQKTF